VGAGIEQDLRERTQTGADLEDAITLAKFRERNDARQLVLVMQDVLPERFGEMNPAVRENRTHFGQLHT
jgi:hypothetical protein